MYLKRYINFVVQILKILEHENIHTDFIRLAI